MPTASKNLTSPCFLLNKSQQITRHPDWDTIIRLHHMHIAVITVFIGTSPTLTLAYSYFKGLTSISPLRTNPA